MRAFTTLVVAGNLTRDPDTKYSPSGMAITNIHMALSRKVKDEERVTWARFTAFGKMAETLNQYLAKGNPVLLSVDQVEVEVYTRKDGQAGATLVGIIQGFSFIGSSGNARGVTGPSPSRPPAPTPMRTPMDEDNVPW